MSYYVIIQGKTYVVDADTQQNIASRALTDAGINSTRVWYNGVSTKMLLLADADVNPVENGTRPDALAEIKARVKTIENKLDCMYRNLKAEHSNARDVDATDVFHAIYGALDD